MQESTKAKQGAPGASKPQAEARVARKYRNPSPGANMLKRVVVITLSGKGKAELQGGLERAVEKIMDGCVQGEMIAPRGSYTFQVTDI